MFLMTTVNKETRGSDCDKLFDISDCLSFPTFVISLPSVCLILDSGGFIFQKKLSQIIGSGRFFV